jgi:tagatose 6-phosphate kinase
MIITVTLNPILERRLEYSAVTYGAANRDPVETLNAGGKGINVSRQLNQLQLHNNAFTFTGGFSGKIFRKIIAEEEINASYVQIKDETRNGTVVIDRRENKVSTFFGRNSVIEVSESNEFLSRLERMIVNCEMLVLSGSSPSPSTDQIFPAAIRMANEMDKITVLDTYGKHLVECIEASPTIIHNNIDELASVYNLPDESSILTLLDNLYSKGIKQAYITNGPEPFFASNFDFHFKIFNPPIDEKDPVGSGDAFTAGICYGWHNNLTFEETAVISSSLGAANASVYDVCRCSMQDVEQLRENVRVVPVGKKMKTVDVNPH